MSGDQYWTLLRGFQRKRKTLNRLLTPTNSNPIRKPFFLNLTWMVVIFPSQFKHTTGWLTIPNPNHISYPCPKAYMYGHHFFPVITAKEQNTKRDSFQTIISCLILPKNQTDNCPHVHEYVTSCDIRQRLWNGENLNRHQPLFTLPAISVVHNAARV